MNPSAISHFVTTVTGLEPDMLALLGALGTLGVALQGVLLVAARFVPAASGAAKALATLTMDLAKCTNAAIAASKWLAARVRR